MNLFSSSQLWNGMVEEEEEEEWQGNREVGTQNIPSLTRRRIEKGRDVNG